MKTLLILTMIATLTGCATLPCCTPSVALEIRTGSQSPAPGFSEMRVVGSGEVVYISQEVILTNLDVASSRVVSGPHGLQIEIVLTGTGAEKFAVATKENLQKPMGILVDGELISAPIVRATIGGGKAVISGGFSQEEATRISTGISAK